jgi:hypothetical protein
MALPASIRAIEHTWGMITIPQVQRLIVEAAGSNDPQVRALGAIGAALMLLYMQNMTSRT